MSSRTTLSYARARLDRECARNLEARGLRDPTIAREERIRKLLPLDLTPFDEAERRALA